MSRRPHSSDAVAPLAGAGDHTETWARLGQRVSLDAGAVEAAQSILDCGYHERGTTFCLDTSDFEPGDYYVFANVMEATIPWGGSERYLTYGFVMDANGLAEDNFAAHPAYPNDWYQGTDGGFELSQAALSGWRFARWEPSTEIPPPSAGIRLIGVDNAAVLLVPASELSADQLGYRVTAFSHEGDFGMSGGAWSGDVEPPVDEGLANAH